MKKINLKERNIMFQLEGWTQKFKINPASKSDKPFQYKFSNIFFVFTNQNQVKAIFKVLKVNWLERPINNCFNLFCKLGLRSTFGTTSFLFHCFHFFLQFFVTLERCLGFRSFVLASDNFCVNFEPIKLSMFVLLS